MNGFPQWFLPSLMVWSAVWAALAVCRAPCEAETSAWRHFWRMSGLWAALNVIIAASAVWNPPTDPEEVRGLLKLNGWLDLGYIAVGGVLVAFRRPITRGFGWAVIIQGLFLLALDWGARMSLG